MDRKKDRLAREISGDLEGCGPDKIVQTAFEVFRPVRSFVGFSGGFDSLVTTHWCMNNIECEVFHINTGIGIERTRKYVRLMCMKSGWPLVEIRAKEDCGQDYEELVMQHGFPGPAMHYKMFQRLKERCVWELLKRSKKSRFDNVMLITGLRKDESARRSGYKYSVLDFMGNLLWVNPFYYKTKEWFNGYVKQNNLEINPVHKILGMSGECLCGAYAHKGEKSLIKMVCPESFERISLLESRVDLIYGWGWEGAPPRKSKGKRNQFMPLCVGCEKDSSELMGIEDLI